MPGNVCSISAGVYIRHPVMVRIDEFRAVSNLLVCLLPKIICIIHIPRLDNSILQVPMQARYLMI